MRMIEEDSDSTEGMTTAGGGAVEDVGSTCCRMQVLVISFSKLIVSSQHGM